MPSRDPEILIVGALGGAYRGDSELRHMVTHAMFDRDGIKASFCGRDKNRLADRGSVASTSSLPTCPKCLARLSRYLDDAEAGKTTRFPLGAGPQ
jgi:hypothetical protein